MAGPDLSLDVAQLRQLADDLQLIKAEFEKADDNASDAAAATGHDELRSHVEDFADKWRIKRGDMMADLTTLADVMTQIADTMTQVDIDLARSLEDAAGKAVRARG